MIAHIRKEDGEKQTLYDHCINVSKLCKNSAEKLHLSVTAELIGILHDMGKGTVAFAKYLENVVIKGTDMKSPHTHASTGAIFVLEQWNNGEKINRITAQIIALCISGHHASLQDCLDTEGNSPFLEATIYEDKAQIFYDEAVNYYLKNIADINALTDMFITACAEVNAFLKVDSDDTDYKFNLGLLAKILLSILVDSDRWDTSCFEYHNDSMTESHQRPDWIKLLNILDNYTDTNFKHDSEIAKIRSEISEACIQNAKENTGVFRLSVPTGGGKTLSSLRFALKHAHYNCLDRIYFIIPYNTILDQNAEDIETALNHYSDILEHHCNVIKESPEESLNYKKLTERWDSSIILTSLVQFLNTIYKSNNTNTRRMHNLANSVLIFDEVQSLPVQCKALFEKVVQFLTEYCHSTIVLCTATQPRFNIRSRDMISPSLKLTERMKRVSYFPELYDPKSDEEASTALCDIIRQKQAVLVIVNTKKTAWDVFNDTKIKLRDLNEELFEIPDQMDSNEYDVFLSRYSDNFILCVHLSTNMCPSHRLQAIHIMKKWLKKGNCVLCVSTALIEAGINVSFPIVVRSLSGLPSIIQAAGRCNRNMENTLGKVLIWHFESEKLTSLPDIQTGQDCSRRILCNNENIDSEKNIETYYKRWDGKTKQKIRYPYPKNHSKNLVSFLSDNQGNRIAARDCHPEFLEKMILLQSFRTAGDAFQVIDQDTKSLLVPYGKGKYYIEELNRKHRMEELIQLYKEIQAYSVSTYPNVYESLSQSGALVECSGVVCLKEGFYNNEGGLQTEERQLEFLGF